MLYGSGSLYHKTSSHCPSLFQRSIIRPCLPLLIVIVVVLLAHSVSSQDISPRAEGDTAGNKGCSFQRGGCTYNIYLSPNGEAVTSSGSDESLQSVERRTDDCGEANRHVVLEDQAQNDYTAKLDSMEKNFSFLRDAHENRLKELEGTIQQLVDTSINWQSKPVETTRDTSSSDGLTSNNIFLRQLEDEFEKLKAQLRDKSRELLDTQSKLNETSTRVFEEQVRRFKISRSLLDAENQILGLKKERMVLKNQLKDRAYNLNLSNKKAMECEKRFTAKDESLSQIYRSEATLKEELGTVQLRLNASRVELGLLTEKHSQLKSRQASLRRTIKRRENDLMACYSSKTSTFCGFEDPKICGFTNINDTSDFFDWDRAQGSTPSKNTGPSSDHTCGAPSGHFMYIEASAKGIGKNAILYSPLYRGQSEQCVEFFYHMLGRDIGTLNVYAKARGDSSISVWRAYGDQGDYWTNARLGIPKELAQFGYQIAFEAITAKGFQGDISIDDVSVTDGPCPVDPRITPVMVKVSTMPRRAKKNKRKQRRRPRNGRKRGRGQSGRG